MPSKLLDRKFDWYFSLSWITPLPVLESICDFSNQDYVETILYVLNRIAMVIVFLEKSKEKF